MQRLQSISDRVLAALMLFTRLPWWRLKEVPTEAFRHAVEYWPFAGWVTGGVSVAIFAIGIKFMPLTYVVLTIISARLLLTGALHEDGLADFFDGMGGGNTKERTLQIMKDSHIGTYGVLALIVYFLFLYNVLSELPVHQLKISLTSHHNPILVTCATLLTADILGKSSASLLISHLPYARREEEAKTGVVYERLNIAWQLLRVLIALIPVAILWAMCGTAPHPVVFVVPFVTESLMFLYLNKRIGGYTGDCCGATFLLCEISFYLAVLLIPA